MTDVHDATQSLAGALRDLMRWLDGEGLAGSIVGGVAASILGRPRLTRDVDAVILADEIGWETALKSAARYGIEPRVEDALGFAHGTRVLLLRHVPTDIDLDISLGALPFERELVERSFLIQAAGIELRLATAEDIVVMKALARRPRDIADIEGILDVQTAIDLDRIPYWLREFSSVLESPEIHEEFERLLRQKRK